jgi:hypothetical protein
MPVIQLLRKQRSRGSWFEASPGKQFAKTYLEKKKENLHKKGMVEWLEV